jgi:hypothetical protein
MSLQTLAAGLHGVTLGEAIWLFPVAFALHVCEEWPRFPMWAQRHASAAFTRREYVAVHLAGLLTALLVPILWHLFPLRWVAFVLFAVVLIPITRGRSVPGRAARRSRRRRCVPCGRGRA